MEDLIIQHQDLIKYLLQQLENKTNECNSYKLKLGEIQYVLNSEVKVVREGFIKKNESGEC